MSYRIAPFSVTLSDFKVVQLPDFSVWFLRQLYSRWEDFNCHWRWRGGLCSGEALEHRRWC